MSCFIRTPNNVYKVAKPQKQFNKIPVLKDSNNLIELGDAIVVIKKDNSMLPTVHNYYGQERIFKSIFTTIFNYDYEKIYIGIYTKNSLKYVGEINSKMEINLL